MFEAVRHGPSPYTDAQRQNWVPEPRSGADWTTRLARQAVIVAEDESGAVGFMSLADRGYIDFAYIRPHARGKGVFRLLYAAIEQHGRAQGVTRFWVHASLMARPAFAAVGFSVVERQVINIEGERLERFEMQLML